MAARMTGRAKQNSAPHVAASDERHRAAGETQRKVWAHPKDWPAIRALEKSLREVRQKACISANVGAQ